MNDLLIVSNVLLWIIILIQFIALLALARQLGRILIKIGPMPGAAVADVGPNIGEPVSLENIRGTSNKLQTIGSDGKDTMFVFVLPGCTSCEELYPALKILARSERHGTHIVVANTDSTRAIDESISKLEGRDIIVVSRDGLAKLFSISTAPYAVLIDNRGIVRAKGIANHLFHLVQAIASPFRVDHQTTPVYTSPLWRCTQCVVPSRLTRSS